MGLEGKAWAWAAPAKTEPAPVVIVLVRKHRLVIIASSPSAGSPALSLSASTFCKLRRCAPHGSLPPLVGEGQGGGWPRAPSAKFVLFIDWSTIARCTC